MDFPKYMFDHHFPQYHPKPIDLTFWGCISNSDLLDPDRFVKHGEITPKVAGVCQKRMRRISCHQKKENLIVYHINIVIRPWRLDKLVIDHQLDFFMILIWGILIIPHFIVDDFKQCQRQEGPGSGRFLALRRIRRCLRDGRELSHQNGLDFLSHSTANNGIMDVKLICILIDTSGFNIN